MFSTERDLQMMGFPHLCVDLLELLEGIYKKHIAA